MKYIFILFTLLSISSCNTNHTSDIPQKPIIYTSFYPLSFLTSQLIWEQADIISIVPEWSEVHDFEPSLQQIWSMQQADLIILNGLWLESYEEKFLNTFDKNKIILASETLTWLLNTESHAIEETEHNTSEHNHGNINPHTWLSPKMFLQMWNNLAILLEEKWFTINKNILNELQNLDNTYQKTLQNCQNHEIITSHDAFWYMAHDYNFEQHAVFWISPDQEPSTKQIKEITDLIHAENIEYIYTEEFISQKFSQSIQNETNVKIESLHTLEAISPTDKEKQENYLTLMNKNLEKIQLWLKCNQ